MRANVLSFACAAWLAGCAAAGPAEQPRAPSKSVPLRNAGFEDPPRVNAGCAEHWSCTMHADPGAFRFFVEAGGAAAGKQSLCVERVTPEPWALVTQGVQDPKLRGARLRFSLAVRVDRADGEGAGPWALVHGPQGNLAHAQRLVKSTQGWQRLAIEFPVAPSAQLFEVGLTLEGGGRVCLDDARLEIID